MVRLANYHGRTSRRSFLAVVGAVTTISAGCLQSDPEPRGKPVTVEWKLDPDSTGEYEHIRTLRDDRREWTWFEGKFIATEQGVVGFEHELRFRYQGETIDRMTGDFKPGDYSSIFKMDPGEFSTYEYAVQDNRVPTAFEVLVEQVTED